MDLKIDKDLKHGLNESDSLVGLERLTRTSQFPQLHIAIVLDKNLFNLTMVNKKI